MTDIERELMPAQPSAAPSARPGVTDYLLAMGHELRAPLNAVIGMSGLLLDGDLSEQQRQYVRSVNAAGETLGTILNDVLDLARVSHSRLVVEPIPFDLKSMIEETASVLTPKANERGLALRVDLRPELPRHVIGDPGRTRQVLGNLVGHAVSATSQGEVVIRVLADQDRGDQPWIRFVVEDTGIGVTASRLARVFEEYVPVDASPYRSFGVTGLGLRLSAELVRLMDGEIGAESVPGRGSKFWFALPMPVAAPTGTASPAGRISSRGGRCLIVEADLASRSRLADQLEVAGWDVQFVDDAERVVAELREGAAIGNPYHACIFSHYAVRPIHADLACRLKADPALASVALVMVTAVGSPGEGKRLWHAGFAAYLRKPVPNEEIRETLHAIEHVGPSGRGPTLITRHSLAETRNAESFATEGIDEMLASLRPDSPEPESDPVEFVAPEAEPAEPAEVEAAAPVESGPVAVEPETVEPARSGFPRVAFFAAAPWPKFAANRVAEPWLTTPPLFAAPPVSAPAVSAPPEITSAEAAEAEPAAAAIDGYLDAQWEAHPVVEAVEGLEATHAAEAVAEEVSAEAMVEAVDIAPPGADLDAPADSLVDAVNVAPPGADLDAPADSLVEADESLVENPYDGAESAEVEPVLLESPTAYAEPEAEPEEVDEASEPAFEPMEFEPTAHVEDATEVASVEAPAIESVASVTPDAEVEPAEEFELLATTGEHAPLELMTTTPAPTPVVPAAVAPTELDVSGLDVASPILLDQVAHGGGFFTQYQVVAFLREVPARIGDVATAATRGDAARISQALASLRLIADSVGAAQLSARAASIVTAVERGQIESATMSLGEIERSFLEARQAFDAASPSGLPADPTPVGGHFVEQLSPAKEGPARMLAQKLAASFIADAPKRFADLQAAVAAADGDGVQRVAQTFKGMCGLVGADPLAKLVALTEADARLRRVAQADRYLGHIELELNRVIAALERARA